MQVHRLRVVLVALGLVAASAVLAAPVDAAPAKGPGGTVLFGATGGRAGGAVVVKPGCLDHAVPRGDDNSSASVAIGFPFHFFGSTYDDVFVNTNGNVSFGSALSTYSPARIRDFNAIGVFWADTDTRTGGNPVTYGTTTWNGRPAFCALWDGVGYYPNGSDHLNRYQILLVDRSDRAAGDSDVVLNYDAIDWSKPTARVGFAIAGSPSTAYELPGSGDGAALLDEAPPSAR